MKVRNWMSEVMSWVRNVSVFLCVAQAGICLATDGAWSVDANGTWSDAGNWSGGVPDGTGSKASFSTLFTGGRTVTINGLVLSPTVGSIDFGNFGNMSVNVANSNNGFLKLDNGNSPISISTATNVFNEIKFSTPITIAENKRLNVYNNYNGDKYLKLAGVLSGKNIIIANCGTGIGGSVSLEGLNNFTGEVWAVSTNSRLNLVAGNVDEISGGDPYNTIRVFPNGRLTISRYGQALVNPLRTIVMEGQGVSGIGVFYNPGENNEKKHIPAPITGDGGLQTSANFVLSGSNTFTGPMKVSGGTLQIASMQNIGTGTLVVEGFGSTLSIVGRELKSFGTRTTDFNVGNNGGTALSLSDPDLVFTLDRELNLALNSGGATALGKVGPGELLITVPQPLRNATGRMFEFDGGTVTVDYAAGASLYGPSINSQNRIGFRGGALNLRTTGSSTNMTQNLGDFWLYGDGGKLVVDNRNASGTMNVSVGSMALKNSVDNGQVLSLEVRGDTSKVVWRSSDTNNAVTGIWGAGRLIFQGADWPVIASGTNLVSAYSGYTALASTGSSGNALVEGSDSVPASQEINTLKISTTTSGQSLSIDNAATLSLKNNALLFTGSENYTVQGGRMGGGRTASDFLLHQYGTGTLTLDADIVNTNGITGFTKTGPGKVVLARKELLGGTFTIAEGVLQISMPESFTYTNGTLLGVTSSTSSPLVTSTTNDLPYGFMPGSSSFLGQTVNSINGTSGNWTITLSGNANAALSAGSATYVTRPTVRNNGKLRVTESMTIPNPFFYGGNGAKFDIADGKTNLLTGSKSGGVFILENTDAIGNGVVRVSGVIEMGSGVFLRRGVYESDADNLSSTGVNPLVFGNGNIATLRMRGGKTFLVSELSGTNANAIVETWTTGTTLFGILNGGDNRFDGVIRNGTGAIRLVKGGGGTLTLTGNNTYTGATDIKGGVLKVNGSLASASTVTVQRGTLAGSGTVAGSVTVKNGGKIAPGSSAGTLNTGALTLESGSVLDFELGASGASDLIAVTGNLTLDGVVNVAGLEGFSAGSYPIITYTGALTDNGLDVGSLPDTDLRYSVHANAGVVTLSVGAPGTVIILR